MLPAQNELGEGPKQETRRTFSVFPECSAAVRHSNEKHDAPQHTSSSRQHKKHSKSEISERSVVFYPH